MKLMLRKLNVALTALLFAVYSAYNVFVAVRDSRRGLPPYAIVICVIVALIYAVFTAFMVFALAVGVQTRNIRLLIWRRTAFIISLIAVFVLKLRMAGQVIAYLDITKLHTILYTCAYLTTQIGLVLLLIYYIFILKDLPLFPRASVALPLAAASLFLFSLALEAVLFFVFRIGLEDSPLRTILMRPVFYLGLIGLSLYFRFPPQIPDIVPDQRPLG